MPTQTRYLTYRDLHAEYSEKWYHMMMLHNPKYCSEMTRIGHNKNATIHFGSNPLLILECIHKFIQDNWSFKALSHNPNITFELVIQFGYEIYDWNWMALTCHANITFSHIANNMHLPWDFKTICRNPNISIEELHILDKTHPNLDILDYIQLSQSDKISLDFVIQNIDKPWWWQYLSCNPVIPIQDILDHPELPWSWTTMAEHPGVTWEIVKKYKDKYWSWYYLTLHKNINLDIIDNNIEFPWLWRNMSKRSDLTLDFIEKHIHQDWDWKDLSLHPVITKDFYMSHLHLDWDAQIMGLYMEIVPDRSPDAHIFWGWCSYIPNKSTYHYSNPYHYDGLGYYEKVWKTLSMSTKMTMDIIEKYIDLQWDWEELSKRQDITLAFIEKHKERPWNWRFLSRNPHLKMEFILKNVHKGWEWRWLSRNKLNNDREEWIYQRAIERIAARRIHRFWRDVCWNPEYTFGNKRLLQLFNE